MKTTATKAVNAVQPLKPELPDQPGFTPGPWEVKGRDRFADWVIQSGPGSGFAVIANTSPQAENPEANARLIAAAPAMFEALQAVSRLDYLSEHNALAEQVRNAIAKALGR